jgi:peptide/nickel transport system ATP-binding protein
MSDREPILSVEHLSIHYTVGAGTFRALRDVSFKMYPGEVVGIVGETGCGKSTLAHTIPRLLPEPPAQLGGGRVVFQGVDLMAVPKWKFPRVRGTGIGMIFQEPINSLNPAFRIYDQIAEAVRIRRLRDEGKMPMFHPGPNPFDYSKPRTVPTTDALAHPLVPKLPEGSSTPASRADARSGSMRAEVLDYLRLVRINDPETILKLYPHQLSGGMRQRIMIAMALSERPSLLIADEPTSALDVTIQAQVLTLMKELMEEVKTSILFISHDLGVIAETADDVGVMYAGQIVEFGPVEEIFQAPRHPYTKALLRSVPTRYKSEGSLPSLPGNVPNLSRIVTGCAFAPRCPLAQPICLKDPGPALEHHTLPGMSEPHLSACHFAEGVEGLP